MGTVQVDVHYDRCEDATRNLKQYLQQAFGLLEDLHNRDKECHIGFKVMAGFRILACNCHYRHGKIKNVQKDVSIGQKRKKTSWSDYRNRVAQIIFIQLRRIEQNF